MNDKTTNLFNNNPDKNSVFITADGYPFWSRAQATNHGNSLKNSVITEVHRDGTRFELTPGKPKSEIAVLEDNLNWVKTNVATGTFEPKITKDLEDMTVPEVKVWAAEVDNKEDLSAALTLVESKGGKEHINARIEALTENSPEA